MDRQDNPYRPGAGTDPPTLVGRQELLDDFEITVKRALRGKPGKSCMVTGLRGVGKTVLLNRFCGIASEAGVKTVFLEALAGKAKSYSERLFTFPVINSLSSDHATEVINIPAEERGISFEPEAVKIIVDESKGYPYFLQVWGSHVWDIAPASPITVKDVRSARALVLDTLDRDFFRVRLDRLTVKEKEYLQAMAAIGSGPYRSGSIAAELGVRVESVAPRRSNLIQKGMIYSPAHGENQFTVPLFDDFLRRTQ